ncbi:5-formyltetrahydrofolate cyclo-ligase [Wenzhouxiangella sediminis]|uniref:5-formyltetrahydrofolate cyclo-ligase n=1 Tax=Wenzhouxiangella sediminis TaxID=1792836 RepID=A0A3E1KAF6_9GAMM|nr:5-formyltetrahydrofolate cyclo-ligase [Wenzhouxiangella sediminis]RFF31280.1 5-formyltetrahydrofolate cyclo-ligase [Wenzhouxiangella sediminis]
MTASERKEEQRRELIRRRLALDEGQRERADAAISGAVRRLVDELDFGIIAGFVAHRGEPDLSAALSWLDEEDRAVLLPVVRDLDMHFRRWRPDAAMKANRFGIPEPVGSEGFAPAQIDLVLMPLVGFAADGARLGMGAGFYDRAFAFRHGRPDDLPRLVGVAYAVQEAESLPVDDWDVPLDGIITEQGLRWFE